MPVYRRKWKDRKTGETRLGSFYFKFDVDGVTYKETVKTARTKRQAAEAECAARQAVHEGVYGVRGKNQLFTKFVEEVYLPWAEQHHRDLYNERLRLKVLTDYFEGRTLTQISQLAVEQFKRDYSRRPTRYKRPRKARTVNLVLETLSAVLARAVETKPVRENTCRRVRLLDTDELPVKRLTPDEERAILASAPAWLVPVVQLALWTGLRLNEILMLRRSSIDFGRHRLFVSNPKWKKDRRKTEGVPLGTAARALLCGLCDSATDGGLLFPDERGCVRVRQTVSSAFIRACSAAGVKGFRFHDLRHEYGSRLGDADVNLKKIALLMGHARTKQTERYVHPDDAGLLAATEIAARPTIVPAEQRAEERRTA